MRPLLRGVGVLALGIGLSTCGLLIGERLGVWQAPGSAGEGPNETGMLALPLGAAWPGFYFGAAYFAGLLVVQVIQLTESRDGASRPVLWIVRAGAAVSLASLAASVGGTGPSLVQLAMQGSHLVFWATAETCGRSPSLSWRPVIVWGAVFLTSLALLQVLEAERRWAEAEEKSRSRPLAEQDASEAARPPQTSPRAARKMPNNPQIVPLTDSAVRPPVAAVPPASSTLRSPASPPQAKPTQRPENFSEELQRAAVVATVRLRIPAMGVEGSGVIIAQQDSRVYILTACHVTEGAAEVEIRIFSDDSYPRPAAVYPAARVLAQDQDQDLALLALDAPGPPLAIATVAPQDSPSEAPFLALAAGCGGSAPTCHVVRITGKRRVRKPDGATVATVWETETPPIEGDSGGPLFNAGGQVIGVASGVSAAKGYYCHLEAIRRFLEREELRGMDFLTGDNNQTLDTLGKNTSVRKPTGTGHPDREASPLGEN